MSVRLRGPEVHNFVKINRAVFIGDFVQEVLDELTGNDHHPLNEIVEDGLVKNHYIGAIRVNYLVRDDMGEKRKIAEVAIEIDWERHKVNVAGLGKASTQMKRPAN